MNIVLQHLENMSLLELKEFLSEIPAVREKVIEVIQNERFKELYKKIPTELTDAFYLSTNFFGKERDELFKYCVDNFEAVDTHILIRKLKLNPKGM